MKRWMQFNLVGAMGAVVQAGALYWLVRIAGFDYLTTTGLAVEAAIIHNFAWHVLWTFSDRQSSPRGDQAGNTKSMRRTRLPKTFLRFQLQAGLGSIPGNLVLMWAFVEIGKIAVPIANVLAIAACAGVNYYLADRFSFRHHAPDGAPTSDKHATLPPGGGDSRHGTESFDSEMEDWPRPDDTRRERARPGHAELVGDSRA